MRDTIKMKVLVPDPHDLAFIDRIFKACEGLAMVTVPPGQKDYLVLDYTPSTQDDVLAIILDLKEQLNITITPL